MKYLSYSIFKIAIDINWVVSKHLAIGIYQVDPVLLDSMLSQFMAISKDFDFGQFLEVFESILNIPFQFRFQSLKDDRINKTKNAF